MADPPLCAFCGRTRAQVRNLVAGDALGATPVGICEGCVGQSYDMLVKSGALAAKTAPAPAPAAAPAQLDAAGAIRQAIRSMPRSVDVKALRDLTTAGLELAQGNAAQLRILSYDLGNAMAFEEALRARAGVAAFERNVADSLAEAAYLLRLGRDAECIGVLDALASGPLAGKVTPGENVGATMSRLYSRLGGAPWENEVRAVLAELDAIAPRLHSVGLDAGFVRALENQVVHVRARAAMVMHRDQEAIRVLTQQLAVRELDLEALALLVEAYRRVGDPTSAARAQEKAMAHIPKNSAYAMRLAAR